MFDIFVQFWWQFCIVAVLSYCIGSINFAVIFSRVIKKSDVRSVGSGNPGTTNMYRVFGLRMGALTLVCDMAKGVICCLISYFVVRILGQEAAIQAEYLAGLFAVLGHVFPVFYRFRGGKGVATSIGVLFCVQPILMLCCILPMIAVILLTDRMSVMSLLLSVFMIVWTWTMLMPQIGLFCCVMLTLICVVVIFAHRHNIVRLCTGKENSLGLRRALRGKGDHHLQELQEREAKKHANDVESADDNQSEE